MNYYTAICDYERSWSEPPMTDEEREEEQEARANYEEFMAEIARDR